MTDLLGTLSLWNLQIPTTMALAVVATLGYLIGRRRRGNEEDLASRSRRELRRAQAVASELEKIAWMVRHNLAKHHASLAKFKQRVAGPEQRGTGARPGRTCAARPRKSSRRRCGWPPRSPAPTTRSASKATI